MNLTPVTLLTDVKTFFAMTRAVVKGQYKMPWKTFFWVLLCAVYFLSPIDMLPDIVPLLGFADDSAFIIFVLLLVHQDLIAFRQAQQTPKETIIEAEIVDEKDPKKHD
ncbi:MAG: DUF1232 domain-containing protein [Elusimicrobiaceae bacterium]|nr:DUF1232 domain-containing protein [Elusimicrobiaceae bacterium]MBP5616867.1 DUF1232 domain-containing protein [Elusimicrobiaceae bacterium]